MWKLAGFTAFLVVFTLFCSNSAPAEAYDQLDPNGNITIKWDVTSWTGDGYIAVVTIYNFQQYRQIEAPGWSLGWSWGEKEVIWSMRGAQAAEQGDCSRFQQGLPHCCMKTPTIVDLLPSAPPEQQFPNCCRGGVISSWAQDPEYAAAAFRIKVGLPGVTNTTVVPPKNFTLKTPGPGYTCGDGEVGKPTKFISEDGRRTTQAMMTWNATCTYSQFLAQEAPTCCVALSSFYDDTIVTCPRCACGCAGDANAHGSCVQGDSPHLKASVEGAGKSSYTPLVQCTSHMCPIRVHWHIKRSYEEYWRVKVTITNFNYRRNYTRWNLVLQHPNFDDVTQVLSFNYKSLTPYGSQINDTAMLWGLKFFNELLLVAGPMGNVQSEILLHKDSRSFTFRKGWAFPRRVYFNGDNCVMPPPDDYPSLPNSTPSSSKPPTFGLLALLWSVLLLL